MLRINKNKALALLDENERGMISKLADRCGTLEPMETRTCKVNEFTLIAKQSEVGSSKEIHLMVFFENGQKYEYVSDSYMSSTMDKSNYFQFLLNSVSNYKRDKELADEALDVYKENAKNLFPGEELSFAFGGQLAISALNEGDVNRIGQSKYIISITSNYLKSDQKEVLEKDLDRTIDEFYNNHRDQISLATKAQHIIKQSLNLSEKGVAQFIYDSDFFVISRNHEVPDTFDLSYGNTKEGFEKSKHKCLQEKDYENSLTALSPIMLSKSIYEYLQKVEMSKSITPEVLKLVEPGLEETTN